MTDSLRATPSHAVTAPLSHSERLSLFAVLSSCLGVGLLFGIQPPLIAFALEREGYSSFTIGTINSLSTVAIIAFGPLYPRLIDRFTPRWSMFGGMAVSAVVLVLMPLCSGVTAWAVLRTLSGFALGMEWIASEIWLNRLAADHNRGKIMGLYAAVFAGGVFIGPLMLQWSGTTGAKPFLLGTAVLLVTSLPLMAAHRAPGPVGGDAPRRGFGALLRSAPTVMLAGLVAGLVESADISLLPVFGLKSGLGEDRALALITVFLAGNVLLQVPLGHLADRFGRRLMLGACALVSAAGPLLLPAVLGSSPWLWALLLVWGGTMYTFYTQGISLIGDEFPEQDLAAANTLFVMVYCAGGALGPSLGGIAMDATGPTGLLWFVSGGAALLVVQLLVGRRRTGSELRA